MEIPMSNIIGFVIATLIYLVLIIFIIRDIKELGVFIPIFGIILTFMVPFYGFVIYLLITYFCYKKRENR